mgnify:CR=1 FL=1
MNVKNLTGLFGVLLVVSMLTSCSTSQYVQSGSVTRSVTPATALKSKTYTQQTKPEFIPFTYSESIKPVEVSTQTEVAVNSELQNSNNESFSEASNSALDDLISTARTYLGTPYRYGGETRRGIDCSAFVQQAYSALDVKLPRVSSQQAQLGEYVTKSELNKGDLIFFATQGRGRVSHVALVVSNEDGVVKFIHASSSQGVSMSSLNDSYWSKRYLSGRRIVDVSQGNVVLK